MKVANDNHAFNSMSTCSTAYKPLCVKEEPLPQMSCVVHCFMHEIKILIHPNISRDLLLRSTYTPSTYVSLTHVLIKAAV